MEQIGPQGKVTTLIHYVFIVDPERIACTPNMTELHATQHHPNVLRSNCPQAVTCPACKSTEMYKRVKPKDG